MPTLRDLGKGKVIRTNTQNHNRPIPTNRLANFVPGISGDAITYYYARPTRYYVEFKNTPVNVSTLSLNELSLRCSSITIGQIAINTINHRLFGSVRKIANNLNYNDITMSFYCSEDHFELDFFTTWINEVVNTTSFQASYYDDYVGEIHVYQLTKEQNPYDGNFIETPISWVHKYTNIYPISINEIQLGYSNTNQIENINVTFAWR